jgi:hypothetical protein
MFKLDQWIEENLDKSLPAEDKTKLHQRLLTKAE